MLALFFVALQIGIALAIVYLLFRIWRKLEWLYRLRLKRGDLFEAVRRQAATVEGRAYLERTLQLEAGTLPPLGGWAASADFAGLLADHVLSAKPQTVVEFGSGITTFVTARAQQLNGSGRLITFDHDATFADITRHRAERMGLPTDIRVVPLRDEAGYQGKWYVADELPEAIDLIVVDGPPMAFHAETRGGAGSLFDRLRPGGVVLLDDAGRPGERAIVKLWKARFPAIDFVEIATEKGTAIGTKRSG